MANDRFVYPTPFGANCVDGSSTRFSLWAPGAEAVSVVVENGAENDAIFPMQRDETGVHTCTAPVPAGSAYRYRISGDRSQVSSDLTVPDPASRLQQGDVHDPSLVVDPSRYRWRHPAWRGRPWTEMVIYEVHAGVYGGFAGVKAHLAEWAELGITAIELMPIADFFGQRNWGYDGVLPYAPDRAYGNPDDLKDLIDTAHGLNLCVYLDVVYNHFGPEGNYLHSYAPAFFDADKPSPWGPSIDFCRQPVRDFFTHNAVYWLQEYRFDGLRFDAVHAIADQSWLEEMAIAVCRAVEPDRQIHLVLENEHNTSRHLEQHFDAQWNDDAHNVVHVLLTGEDEGYYKNYQHGPTRQLARALAEGFVYQGEPAPARDNRPRGTPSAHLPPHRFVFFLQNHDQTGNRALGERLTQLADADALRAAVVMQLLCPQIPLLFMGEERGCRAPFLFFTDFTGDLAAAVREGRRREFAAFRQFAGHVDTIPDPNDPATFQASVGDLPRHPEQLSEAEHTTRAFYRELLALRRRHIIPHLANCRTLRCEAVGDGDNDGAVLAVWQLTDQTRLIMAINLGGAEQTIEKVTGDLLFESRDGAGHAAMQGRLPARATSVFIQQLVSSVVAE